MVQGWRWTALRVGVGLALFLAFLPVDLYCLPLTGQPWGLYRWRFPVAAISSGISAAATAWMLDRFYFRRGDVVAESPARP